MLKRKWGVTDPRTVRPMAVEAGRMKKTMADGIRYRIQWKRLSTVRARKLSSMQLFVRATLFAKKKRNRSISPFNKAKIMAKMPIRPKAKKIGRVLMISPMPKRP